MCLLLCSARMLEVKLKAAAEGMLRRLSAPATAATPVSCPVAARLLPLPPLSHPLPPLRPVCSQRGGLPGRQRRRVPDHECAAEEVGAGGRAGRRPAQHIFPAPRLGLPAGPGGAPARCMFCRCCSFLVGSLGPRVCCCAMVLRRCLAMLASACLLRCAGGARTEAALLRPACTSACFMLVASVVVLGGDNLRLIVSLPLAMPCRSRRRRSAWAVRRSRTPSP